MTTETFASRTAIDYVAPLVRLYRGTLQYLMASTFTGEYDPTINYGWDTDTTIAEFEEFNAIAQWQIRLAPTILAVYLLWLGSAIPLRRPRGVLLIPTTWIVGQIVLLGIFDPLAGVYEVLTR